MHTDPLLLLIQRLNANPYSLTKSECISEAEALRAALAAPAAQSEHAEPLKGWKLNHVRAGSEEGTAEIGYLDPEDDGFSPIVTVDTGLYYQDKQAVPLAVAILGMLQDASAAPAAPSAPAGWSDAESDAARLALELECLLTDRDMPTATVSRWWDSAHEALQLHRDRLAAAPTDGGQHG